MKELTPANADKVLAAQEAAICLLLGRLCNKPGVGQVML